MARPSAGVSTLPDNATSQRCRWLDYVELAAGTSDFGPFTPSVGRRSDGSVVVWGGSFGVSQVPALPAGLTYLEVEVGESFAVARRSDGAVVAWGDNSLGQCNVPPLPLGVVYVELATGAEHTVARRSDGRVVAWGDDSHGECDLPDPPIATVFAKLAAGNWRSAALYEAPPACGSVSLTCWPGARNSVSPSGATFQVEGCPSIVANELVFTVTGLPPGVPGIFNYGPQQIHSALGNGWACVGGGVQRVLPPLLADPTGKVVFPVDLTSFPFSGSANTITAGSSWNFQYWYRDPNGNPTTYNFSDAQHIVFAP
jgi:hypothetical protein